MQVYGRKFVQNIKIYGHIPAYIYIYIHTYIYKVYGPKVLYFIHLNPTKF